MNCWIQLRVGETVTAAGSWFGPKKRSTRQLRQGLLLIRPGVVILSSSAGRELWHDRLGMLGQASQKALPSW